MSSPKIITVFGATGNQGGSVVAAILSNPSLSTKYKIRAITRDPSKPNAQALVSKGAEVAKADLNDSSSVASAIRGSYGVFSVTNYWESMSKEIEIQQGQNIVNACKAEGIKHLVWSCLPHVTKLTGGVLTKVEHFDSKAEVAEYAEQTKGDMLVSYFMPGYFMSNLKTQFKLDPSTNVPTLSLPWDPMETWLPMLDIAKDTGLFVAGLYEAGKAANGVFIQGVSEWKHPQEVVDIMTEVAGREVRFVQLPASVESAAKLEKIPEEIMQNMMLIRDYSYFGIGAEKKQAESDKFLVPGSKKSTYKGFAENAGPWKW